MKKHGCANTKEYRCWVRMIHRCHNPDYPGYHNYGGRGITVCAAWRDEETGFETFLRDLGKAPGKDFSIEREKNHLGYSPDNCVWATAQQQANNRRTNVLLQHPETGEQRTMTEWARHLGITRKCLWKRLALGWSLTRIFRELPRLEPARRAA